MELSDVLLKRRSVRTYTNKEIPEDTLKKILRAGLIAPTSMNRRPCELIVVKDKARLKKLSQAKSAGANMLADSSAAVVVIADSYRADTWVEDSSIALAYMNLMATDLGIGSCWCQIHLRTTSDGRDAEDAVREILAIEDKYRIVGILALGMAKAELPPHTWEEADLTKVCYL
ncbi:MAG: nitroreductase family protein [Selenomonadales bacterium]|nr:nitroreductase family protein [Selenomonadales bacterium]